MQTTPKMSPQKQSAQLHDVSLLHLQPVIERKIGNQKMQNRGSKTKARRSFSMKAQIALHLKFEVFVSCCIIPMPQDDGLSGLK
jgi:hypothetical protein